MTRFPTSHVKDVSKSVVKGKTGTNISTAIMLIEGGYKVYNWLRDRYYDKFSFHVSVSERQAIYGAVNDWLLEVVPQEKHKSLSVYSSKNSNMVSESPDDGDRVSKVDPLTLRFNDKVSRQVYIEGHRVEVRMTTPDITDEKFYERMDLSKEIVFTTMSHEGQRAVIRHLEVLNQKRVTTRKGVLMMMNQWGGWRKRSDLPPRTMDSVNLPPEQKTRIIKDLEDFLNSEDRYNTLAIPFHRGYMFHGPPGTGKTSIAKALANHFNLDMWYVSLSDLSAESSLISLLSEVGPRSMLLLEDIDTMQITHDRDSAEQGKISMGSLLNVLDGVATPHGLVTVMTTNRFDILDPALTRAGRMDLVEKIDWPSLDTVSVMFEYFYNRKANWSGLNSNDFEIYKISTSQIAEIMKRNLHNPEQAIKDIREMVKLAESLV